MKNPLKRIVPILLALAVIASCAWYFLIYDRDFARDLLISQARYWEEAGNHDIGHWFYDQAYLCADNDDTVAIELAHQYQENNNFTKAEYTLTNAIATKPSVELYTALCRLFVEQDKLIDAVALLDKISDPTLKQEMDALRPATPEPNYAPAFYNQYLEIQLTSPSGTLLFSTDREYPSVYGDVYQDPIALDQGETMIYTLCVGENGLVSPLGIYGYTVGGVVEEVTFADPHIEEAIRSQLGFSPDQTVYSDDLWTISGFTVPQDAETYVDLTKLTYLTELVIYNANPEELGFLSMMPQLQKLTITGSNLDQATVNSISAMSGLTRLTLAECGLSDLSALAALEKLEYLDLSYNFIRDLSPLAGMDSLRTLYLSHNALSDLTSLGNLHGLETLNVSYNSLSSIEPLSTIRNLRNLDVSHNQLTELSELDLIPGLSVLNASYNQLTEVSVLGRCAALTELDLAGNVLDDIDALENLSLLRELNCSHNQINELPRWNSDSALVILDASYNQIDDVTVLGKLQSLNRINMDYNPQLRSVEALSGCPNLIEVHLFGTRVTDVKMLTDQSIIVHYNPTDVSVDVPETTE